MKEGGKTRVRLKEGGNVWGRRGEVTGRGLDKDVVWKRQGSSFYGIR